MSVLIKGLKMPKENAICVVIFPDGRVTSQFGVPHLGTAVPVPPHGRLIDADAYEKLLRGLGNRDYRREAGTLQDAIKFLHPHYAPTIIPAEEGE